MNILLVNTFYSPDILGGAEISVQKLAESLVKKGHNVYVFTTSNIDKNEEINEVKILRRKIKNLYNPIDASLQNMYKKTIYRIIDIFNVYNSKIVKDILVSKKIDIVHTNNLYGISPIIWKIAKGRNIPVIHTLRDYNLYNPKGNNIKKVTKSIFSAYQGINKKLSLYVDYVTAPSNFTLNFFLDKGYFKNAQSKRIFNAIDINNSKKSSYEVLKTRNTMISQSDKVKFVFIGTLDFHKGIKFLLEAFSKISNEDIELHIAGKGPLKNLVESYSINDKRIIFYGFLGEYEIGELLSSSHVLIAPSLWQEPFGRVIIDAYKYSLPVISTRVGGIPEIVTNNKEGILIDPYDEESLIRAIRIFRVKDNIIKMAEESNQKLYAFNINNQTKDFQEVYENVLY